MFLGISIPSAPEVLNFWYTVVLVCVLGLPAAISRIPDDSDDDDDDDDNS